MKPPRFRASSDGCRPATARSWSTMGRRTLRPPIAYDLGATVVSEPRRGFGSACYAGLLAATADVVCFMDCDGSLDGADLPSVVGPVIAGVADLTFGARVAAHGAWPIHARVGNRVLARQIRRRTGLRLARPRTDARRASRTTARPRNHRSTLRVATRNGGARAPRRMGDHRDRRAVPTARREVEGDWNRARHRPDRTRHGRGTPMGLTARADATLIVLAKAPVPGRVKTRLCPPCTPAQAAAIARAATRRHARCRRGHAERTSGARARW